MSVKYYQNKTFKVYPFYSMILKSCFALYKRDVFTDCIIKSHFHSNSIDELPTLNKVQLLEHMIDSIMEKSTNNQLDKSSFSSERIRKLHNIYNKHLLHSDNNKRNILNARLSPSHLKKITLLSNSITSTIAETIELAIAEYIFDCSTSHYELILFSFEKHVQHAVDNNTTFNC